MNSINNLVIGGLIDLVVFSLFINSSIKTVNSINNLVISGLINLVLSLFIKSLNHESIHDRINISSFVLID